MRKFIEERNFLIPTIFIAATVIAYNNANQSNSHNFFSSWLFLFFLQWNCAAVSEICSLIFALISLHSSSVTFKLEKNACSLPNAALFFFFFYSAIDYTAHNFTEETISNCTLDGAALIKRQTSKKRKRRLKELKKKQLIDEISV